MESLNPSSSNFLKTLKPNDPFSGQSLHAHIIKSGLHLSASLANTLLSFYSKTASLSDARNLFDEIPLPTTQCWNTLLSAYAKRGRLAEALAVFHAMPKRDTVSWTAMIAGYGQNGRFAEALRTFVAMVSAKVSVTKFTATSVLASCAVAGALRAGRKVHSLLVKTGLSGCASVSNSLLNMYAKAGDSEVAKAVFDGMVSRDVSSCNSMVFLHMKMGDFDAAMSLFEGMKNERNVVTWNTVIAGYNQRGFDKKALGYFAKMVEDRRLKPDRFTFTSVLSACGNLGELGLGRQVHSRFVMGEFEASPAMRNALVSMYAKCGKVELARRVLDRSVANVVAFTALLDGYVKLGDVNLAREIFDSLRERDVVVWTAMIVGYLKNNLNNEALELFRTMAREGPEPNKFTFAAILSVASTLGSLDHGKQVHARVVRSGQVTTVSVINALIHMYSKSGFIEAAKRMFELPSNSKTDPVTWTSMILSLAQHGLGNEAVELFDTMLAHGIKPDHITYVAVLSACTHAGLVDKGRAYFALMWDAHKIEPSTSHYTCMIDLLARSGRLEEAFEFVASMPIEPDAAAWGSVLAACKARKNARLASVAAARLLLADPENSGAYATLANVYSACGEWEQAARVRTAMRDRGVKKEQGVSWIRVRNSAHVFGAEDGSHPMKEAIYERLGKLWEEIKAMGFVPDLGSVLLDVEDEVKEGILRHHSEKLAVAFGLIITPEKTTLRIMKNLRVCNDCHSAIKFISKLVGREIVVRDTTRFHHFKDGLCSCKDYW